MGPKDSLPKSVSIEKASGLYYLPFYSVLFCTFLNELIIINVVCGLKIRI